MENASISNTNTNTNNASSNGGFEINSVLDNISISIKKELTPFIMVVEKSNRNMDILKQMLIMLPEYTELRDKYENLLVENAELKAKLGNSSNIHLKINRLPATAEAETEVLPDKTIVSASISNEFKTNEVIAEGDQTKVENNEECETDEDKGETEYETDEEDEEDLTSDSKHKVENDDDCEEEDLTSDSKRKVENDDDCEEEDLSSDRKRNCEEGETEYETDEEDEEEEEGETEYETDEEDEEEDLTSDRKRNCEEEDAKQPIKERKVPV